MATYVFESLEALANHLRERAVQIDDHITRLQKQNGPKRQIEVCEHQRNAWLTAAEIVRDSKIEAPEKTPGRSIYDVIGPVTIDAAASLCGCTMPKGDDYVATPAFNNALREIEMSALDDTTVGSVARAYLRHTLQKVAK